MNRHDFIPAGMGVYINHMSGDCASLECADNEGETVDGLPIPTTVVRDAFKWVESEGIDY